MKLLGSTKNKVTSDKSSENMTHLKMTELVLFHCNIINNDYQHDCHRESDIHLFPINGLVNYYIFH